MYDKLVLILGVDKSDTKTLDLVETLMNLCIDEAKEFTREKDVKKLENLIIKMVIEKYNKLDYAGLNSTSYSGISQNFMSDYSLEVQRLIKSLRHIKII